ncbi:ubiquitin carboxyl-terminal hydrolase [Musa troglodytarum]|uniref:Ubiquitin carboxyl-terminal hydrolase n=1 Tax=Musa troglodytarum TaxID=320322 RepID=A0A9E7LBF0_9LILI|nr:ubiquitin carboxyl-terminal hydrolase [Musa troglodytarum]
MPLHGNPGLSGAASLVFLLFVPLIAFVVRRRWRLASVRQAEVRRLARLAAEEAARAEMEAITVYFASSHVAASAAAVAKDPSARPECPVCLSPATARCARCKAVRYCSGKCQIIHWRQGHKDECHPPQVSDDHSGELKLSGSKGVQAEHSGLFENSFEHRDELNTKAVEMVSDRPAASELAYSYNDINIKNKHEESGSMDVSGMETTSGPSVGTPDDTLTIGNLLPLHDSRPGESSSFDSSTSGLGTAADASYVDPSKSLTSEPGRTSPLANNTFCSSNMKEKASTCKAEADKFMSNAPSGLKATSSFDHTSTKHPEVAGSQITAPQGVDNGIHPDTFSRSEKISSHAFESLERKSQLEHKEMLTSNTEISGSVANGTSTDIRSLNSRTLRPLAYASDQLSSNGGAHPVVCYESSKVSYAPRGPVRSPDTYGSIANGMSTSLKRVVKEFTSSKISRHYSSELMLFPYDRFIKLYNSDKIELHPCGLINCGNRYAIDAMQSACLREAGTKPDGPLAEETTLVQQTFGGYLRSKIRCSRCKSKSERCERMMDLTVEIDGNISTLDEALLRFTSPEILDGENKYECGRCKSYERAKKRLTILEAPNVLTIVLKRFQSGTFGKLNKTVRFHEYLDLAPYMSGDDKSPVYRLYAAIVHVDVKNASFSGHYVCYVKDTQGKWYKINDSKVNPVELEEVLSKGAYMLLYARCSPRAPTSVRKALAHELEQARKTRSRGKPGGSSVARQRTCFYPRRMMDDHSNFYPSDLFNERLRPLLRNDSSSDSSSLFDEGSSCSTESTRDSTSTEEYWERMSGESDSVNLNSPLRVLEESDGFTSSPLSSTRSSKAVSSGSMPDHHRDDDSERIANSSGREINQAAAERPGGVEHRSNESRSILKEQQPTTTVIAAGEKKMKPSTCR